MIVFIAGNLQPEISPRPVFIIAGENAHSRYFSQDAYKSATELKELMIIPNATHVYLYDQVNVILFGKLENYFKGHLKTMSTAKAPVLEEIR